MENGRVTSVVEYLPGARFHAHPHPDGEEILVLSGVFSDATGDWGTDSYLLNPEGFSHAPWSEGGCLLLVRLRQYPGSSTVRAQIDRSRQPALAVPEACCRAVNIEMGMTTVYPGGVELFMLSGNVTATADAWSGSLGKHDWLRLPPGEVTLTGQPSGLALLRENCVVETATR